MPATLYMYCVYQALHPRFIVHASQRQLFQSEQYLSAYNKQNCTILTQGPCYTLIKLQSAYGHYNGCCMYLDSTICSAVRYILLDISYCVVNSWQYRKAHFCALMQRCHKTKLVAYSATTTEAAHISYPQLWFP